MLSYAHDIQHSLTVIHNSKTLTADLGLHCSTYALALPMDWNTLTQSLLRLTSCGL